MTLFGACRIRSHVRAMLQHSVIGHKCAVLFISLNAAAIS